MKKHTSNKLIRAVASLSCVFLFGLTTNSLLVAADSMNSLGTATVQAGEEKMMGNLCINGDCTTICDVDGTNGVSKYSVTAQNTNTQFTMFMKEKDKLIAEKSFTGQGELPFESRKYDSVLFGVKNDMDAAETFTGSVSASNLNCQHYNGAARILAPFAAIISAIFLLF